MGAARKGRAVVRPLSDLDPLARQAGPVTLAEIRERLGTRDRQRQSGLSRRLRLATYDDPVSEALIADREAFDDALSFLGLIELAIQTGYLSLDFIRQWSRTELLQLLWSNGARSVVDNYEYLDVAFLAKRVDIDLGLGDVRPPEPDLTAQIRFAAFLDHLNRFFSSDSIEQFLGILDGYVYVDPEDANYDEADALEAFFDDGSLPDGSTYNTVKRFERLLRGFHEFVALLGDFYETVPTRNWAYYGIYHAYWLAKFFGYEWYDGDDGYVYDAARDWSLCLLPSLELVNDDMSDNEAIDFRRRLGHNRRTIRAVWGDTRRLLERHA